MNIRPVIYSYKPHIYTKKIFKKSALNLQELYIIIRLYDNAHFKELKNKERSVYFQQHIFISFNQC